MRSWGPGGQDPITSIDEIKIGQGFTAHGEGRARLGDDDTDVAPGYLCVFSPTARAPATEVTLFPESARLSQRHSSSVWSSGLSETICFRLGTDVGSHSTEEDAADRGVLRRAGWMWRRLVIQTKLVTPFQTPNYEHVDIFVSAKVVGQGADAAHVRPIIPLTGWADQSRLFEHMFKSVAGVTEYGQDFGLEGRVDTDNHRVLYDKVTPIVFGRTGMARYEMYHKFNFVMEYEEGQRPVNTTPSFARSDRSLIGHGDVFVLDYIVCPSRELHSQLEVDIPFSRYYWKERSLS